MGLGLTVCRTIIRVHRGRLWAEKNAGRGASFHFVLPLAPTAAGDGTLAARLSDG